MRRRAGLAAVFVWVGIALGVSLSAHLSGTPGASLSVPPAARAAEPPIVLVGPGERFEATEAVEATAFSVEAAFRLTSGHGAGVSRLWLVGLRASEGAMRQAGADVGPAPGEAAFGFVYEVEDDDGFGGQARLLLVGPALSGEGDPGEPRIIGQATLRRVLAEDRWYVATLSLRRSDDGRAGELSISLRDTLTGEALAAGHAALTAASSGVASDVTSSRLTPFFGTPPSPALGRSPALGQVSFPWQAELRELTVTPGAYERLGRPLWLERVTWRLLQLDDEGRPSPLLATRVDESTRLALHAEWASEMPAGRIEVRTADGAAIASAGDPGSGVPGSITIPLGRLAPGRHTLSVWFVGEGTWEDEEEGWLLGERVLDVTQAQVGPTDPEGARPGGAGQLSEAGQNVDAVQGTLGPGIAIPAASNKRFTLEGGVLRIDGEPVYLRGIGFYDFTQRSEAVWRRDMARYAEWGMNLVEVFAVPGQAQMFGRFLDVAREAGIYVAAQLDNSLTRIPRPEWERLLLPYLAHWDHPNLVAWVLRDDSYYDEHYLSLLAIRDFIRAYDDQTLITTTMLEPRVPDRLTPRQWADWAALLDFPTPYEYPVLRDGRVFNPLSGTRGGLYVVETLAERTRSVWQDPDLYMWQWVQAHSQRATISELDFLAQESYTATPDQLSLLTFHTLSAGVRGLLYYRDRFFEDPDFGVGRRHELELMWRVLGKVERILAGGALQVLVRPAGDGVEAVAYSLEGETVVLVTKRRHADLRYAGPGEIQPFDLAVPSVTAGSRAYLISPAGATPLQAGIEAPATPHEAEAASSEPSSILRIEVPPLDLTGVILITTDPEHAAAIDAALRAELPKSARAALAVLADTIAKVGAVSAALPPAPAAGPALREAEDAYRRAAAQLSAGDFHGAYDTARRALEGLRSLAQAQLAAADLVEAPPERAKYRASYFSLPKLYGTSTSLANEVRRRLNTLMDAAF